MSMDEYEDAFVFHCDGCGLTAEFARGTAPMRLLPAFTGPALSPVQLAG
jgi:hypothetical protein